MPPLTPYLIYGQVLDDDNSTVRANVSMTATNVRTIESINTTTDSNGRFIFDCANFERLGYVDGDDIVVTANASGTNGQDLRIRFISRGPTQINEIKVEYTTRS